MSSSSITPTPQVHGVRWHSAQNIVKRNVFLDAREALENFNEARPSATEMHRADESLPCHVFRRPLEQPLTSASLVLLVYAIRQEVPGTEEIPATHLVAYTENPPQLSLTLPNTCRRLPVRAITQRIETWQSALQKAFKSGPKENYTIDTLGPQQQLNIHAFLNNLVVDYAKEHGKIEKPTSPNGSSTINWDKGGSLAPCKFKCFYHVKTPAGREGLLDTEQLIEHKQNAQNQGLPPSEVSFSHAYVNPAMAAVFSGAIELHTAGRRLH